MSVSEGAANKIFYCTNTAAQCLTLDASCGILYAARMKSLPLTIREVKATEAVLQRIYENAKLGIRGNRLAYACDLLPSEFRRLCEMDPAAEMAEEKGRADAEKEMSQVVYAAAKAGDFKAAMSMLNHQHDWVAKQQVQVNVAQQISITAALEAAQHRINVVDVEEVPLARTQVLSGARTNADGAPVGAQDR